MLINNDITLKTSSRQIEEIKLMISLFSTNVCLFVRLFGFYGISTFVGYSMPNPFSFYLNENGFGIE